MNIKISREFKGGLDNHLLEKVLFGSKDGKDKDWLCIVEPNIQMDSALHNRDHFFFYKDETTNQDFVYATPRALVNGILTGSSTILYEMSQEDKAPIFFRPFFVQCGLYDLMTQKLCRALIGVAQRDYKQAQKLSSNYDKRKKLYWAEKYTKWVLDYFVVTGKEINIEGKGLWDVTVELRNNLTQLKQSVDDHTFFNLCNLLQFPADIPELGMAEYFYFNSWRESL